MEINEDALTETMTAIAKHFDDELFLKKQEELECYWQFKWDNAMTIEQNTYQFFKSLMLYSNFCRRWEEHHNGSCCVVERVRDTYLMPKIWEFCRSGEKKGGDIKKEPFVSCFQRVNKCPECGCEFAFGGRNNTKICVECKTIY